MITLYVYDKKLSKPEFSPDKVKPLIAKKDTVIWIDLHNPTKKEHEQIKALFDIHPLVIEDCSKTHTRPKIELFKTYNFIVTNGVHYKKDEHNKDKALSLIEFDFIIGKNFLISNHFGPSENIDELKKNTERLNLVMPKGADFVLHAILDIEVDNYFPLLDSIEEELEQVEDIVIKDPSPHLLKKLFKIKRELLMIRKTVAPQREVVGILAKRDYPFISPEAEAYFRDIYDHLIRINDMSDNFRDVTSSILEIHLSVVSNRLNEVMKVLTVIATIMLPLTVVTGIYGMNFDFMPELRWRYGYIWSLTIMAIIAIGMLIYFRRRGWT